jgi:hypothetical protein
MFRALVFIILSLIIGGCASNKRYYSVYAENLYGQLADQNGHYHKNTYQMTTVNYNEIDKIRKDALQECRNDWSQKTISGITNLSDGCVEWSYPSEQGNINLTGDANKKEFMNKFSEKYNQLKTILEKEAKIASDKEKKEEKIREENEVKNATLAKQNLIKLYEKEYGSKCLADKKNLDKYSDCLYKMKAAAYEEERAKEQQNLIKTKLENSDISKTCISFGYKKGTEKYADCMKDLYLQQNAATKNNTDNSSYSYSNTKYADEMLEIERAKAKALQDAADAQRNRNQSDALLEISRRLLNNNNTPATTNQPVNCRSVRVGNTVQTQCN